MNFGCYVCIYIKIIVIIIIIILHTFNIMMFVSYTKLWGLKVTPVYPCSAAYVTALPHWSHPIFLLAH